MFTDAAMLSGPTQLFTSSNWRWIFTKSSASLDSQVSHVMLNHDTIVSVLVIISDLSHPSFYNTEHLGTILGTTSLFST